MQASPIRACVSIVLGLLLGMSGAIAAAPSKPSPPGPATPPGKPVTLGDITCQAQDAYPKLLVLSEYGGGEGDLAAASDKMVYMYDWGDLARRPVLQIVSPLTGKVYVQSLVSAQRLSSTHAPAFSPDGKWVAFTSPIRGENLWRPWLVRSDGSRLRQLRDDGWDYYNPAWRPDGKLLVFGRAKREWTPNGSGVRHLGEDMVLVEVASGELMTSLKPVLGGAKFSPDGKWLLGWPRHQEALVALRLDSGERRTISVRSHGAPADGFTWGMGQHAWAVDSDRVLFGAHRRSPDLPRGPQHSEIWEASVSQGWVKKAASGWLLCASADGRKFLVDRRSARQKYERERAKQPRVQSGDLQLLTVVSIGGKRPHGH